MNPIKCAGDHPRLQRDCGNLFGYTSDMVLVEVSAPRTLDTTASLPLHTVMLRCPRCGTWNRVKKTKLAA